MNNLQNIILAVAGTFTLLNENYLQLYRILGIVSGVLTVVFTLISAVLFFRLRIPRIFGFLTGRLQRRSIRQMQALQGQREHEMPGPADPERPESVQVRKERSQMQPSQSRTVQRTAGPFPPQYPGYAGTVLLEPEPDETVLLREGS